MRHRETFTILYSWLTDSSWIQLIHLIKWIWYKIEKNALGVETQSGYHKKTDISGSTKRAYVLQNVFKILNPNWDTLTTKKSEPVKKIISTQLSSLILYYRMTKEGKGRWNLSNVNTYKLHRHFLWFYCIKSNQVRKLSW